MAITTCHYWWASYCWGPQGCCTPDWCLLYLTFSTPARPSCTLGKYGLRSLTAQRCLALDCGREARHFTTNPRGPANSRPGEAEVLSRWGASRSLRLIQKSPKEGDTHRGRQKTICWGVERNVRTPPLFALSSFFQISIS